MSRSRKPSHSYARSGCMACGNTIQEGRRKRERQDRLAAVVDVADAIEANDWRFCWGCAEWEDYDEEWDQPLLLDNGPLRVTFEEVMRVS